MLSESDDCSAPATLPLPVPDALADSSSSSSGRGLVSTITTASVENSSPSRSPSSSAVPPPTSQPAQIPLSWPPDGDLSLDWIQDLMSVFDWSSRNLAPSEFPSVMPVAVFDSLVLRASKILHKEPNCVRVDSCDSDSKVVVVGDVHGQLHDVLFLLHHAGFPSQNHFYVFNGDYVDRGAWGLETFLLLLAWKIFMSHTVFLLRGNHESKYCTSVYGFEKEVMTKYGNQGKHVYRKCLGCFEQLPLASIIAGCVYTAHGGLFRSISVTPSKRTKKKKNRRINVNAEANILSLGSLEELSNARRSVLDPPWEGSNLIPGDVLWSDPSMNLGLAPNKERGIGLLWGPDCTENFLKKFHLKLIIRSHEGPDAREKRPNLSGMAEGYTIDHVVESGKLITLFSAPDYPQFQASEERYKNKGAYIVLQPPDFHTPVFHSFDAITPRPKPSSLIEWFTCLIYLGRNQIKGQCQTKVDKSPPVVASASLLILHVEGRKEKTERQKEQKMRVENGSIDDGSGYETLSVPLNLRYNPHIPVLISTVVALNCYGHLKSL